MLRDFSLPTSVGFAHQLLTDRLQPGDWVVDATAGNGHDTAFLAQRVSPTGRVFAVDVQAEAIVSTQARLETAQMGTLCTLIHAGHQTLAEHLPQESHGKIAAFVFNLGWLPGHDKTCITRTETTLQAIGLALEWLCVGGLMTVVAYPGHAGGDTEASAVGGWMSALPSNAYEVRHLRPANRQGKSPECWAVRKR
jgi:predicted methyltransferase